MHEEILSIYIQALINGVRTSLAITDTFFVSQIDSKLASFASAYAEAKADYSSLDRSVQDLLEFIDYASHLKIADATPLLVFQNSLLKFKLSLLKSRRPTIAVSADATPPINPISSGASPIQATKFETQSKKIINRGKKNANQESIFNFIKQSSPIRAKEIHDQFSAISSRTVKRSLRGLLDQGLVVKRQEDKTTYYIAL